MKKLTLFTLLVSVLATFGATTAMAGKQSICHIPPGNPANFHTITVSDNAADKHIEKHGDLIGSCFANCDSICDDENACTQDVVSDETQCICQPTPGPLVNCDDSNVCTSDSCIPSGMLAGCSYDAGAMDNVVCDDGDEDTTGDMCTDGVCEGEALSSCPCWTADELALIGDGVVDGVANTSTYCWERTDTNVGQVNVIDNIVQFETYDQAVVYNRTTDTDGGHGLYQGCTYRVVREGMYVVDRSFVVGDGTLTPEGQAACLSELTSVYDAVLGPDCWPDGDGL